MNKIKDAVLSQFINIMATPPFYYLIIGAVIPVGRLEMWMLKKWDKEAAESIVSAAATPSREWLGFYKELGFPKTGKALERAWDRHPKAHRYFMGV